MDEAKRAQFIGAISKALGHGAVPDRVLPDYVTPFDMSHGPQAHMYEDMTQDQVVEMFKTECTKVGTKFKETTKEKLPETLMEVINEWGGGKVVYASGEELQEYGLDAFFANSNAENITFQKWDASKGRAANIAMAQDAEIGVTFPVMGIAETATIVQPSDVNSGRSIGLLPLTHIVVLRKDTIVPRMTQSMAALSDAYHQAPSEFPSNIVHISGPSNTSDIELVRVVGVHGPINVTYILVG